MRCDFIMEFSKYESKAMEEPEKVRKRERERPRNRQTRFVIIIYISDGFLCWIMTCYRTPLFIFIKFGGTLNNWNEKKMTNQLKWRQVTSFHWIFFPFAIPTISAEWNTKCYMLTMGRRIFFATMWIQWRRWKSSVNILCCLVNDKTSANLTDETTTAFCVSTHSHFWKMSFVQKLPLQIYIIVGEKHRHHRATFVILLTGSFAAAKLSVASHLIYWNPLLFGLVKGWIGRPLESIVFGSNGKPQITKL